jgi:Arc/MetJ family transcription regulator
MKVQTDRAARTNVVVDDDLITKVMQLYGFRTKREAIDSRKGRSWR